MKQTWKCDYCHEFGSAEKVEAHEKICSFNPKNKVCNSCKHQEPMDYSMGTQCSIHGITHMFDVESREIECNSYEEDI